MSGLVCVDLQTARETCDVATRAANWAECLAAMLWKIKCRWKAKITP